MDEKNYQPLLNIEDLLPILGRIAIFGGLTDKQLYAVFRSLQRVSYRPDEFVFKQGEQPTHIYIVLSGRVKIFAQAQGTALDLIELGVGQCLGETSVIAVQPHSASAMAMEPTDLIVLSRQSLLAIFDSDVELFAKLILNIAREACRRLHNTDEVLLHYFCGKKC